MCKYQFDPGEGHWVAVKHIMKYMQRTRDMVLAYGGGNLCVDGFIDLYF